MVLEVAVTLALAAAMEFVVAALYTRRMVRRDIKADIEAAKAELTAALGARIDALKPATLANGLDPRDAAQARWAKKAEKEAEAAETRSAIFAFLTERFGPNARAVWQWVPEDIMDNAIEAGSKWRFILDPILKKAVAQERAAIQTPSSNDGAWS